MFALASSGYRPLVHRSRSHSWAILDYQDQALRSHYPLLLSFPVPDCVFASFVFSLFCASSSLYRPRVVSVSCVFSREQPLNLQPHQPVMHCLAVAYHLCFWLSSVCFCFYGLVLYLRFGIVRGATVKRKFFRSDFFRVFSSFLNQ